MERLVTVEISLGSLLKVLVFLIVVAMVWVLRDIVMAAFLAMLLAGMFYPLIQWADKKNLPKGIVIAGVLLTFFLVVGGLLAFLVPAIIEQGSNAITSFNGIIEQTRFSAIRDFVHSEALIENIQNVISKLASHIDGITQGFAFAVVVLVLSFYMLLEEQRARILFKDLIPSRYQDFVMKTLWQVMEKLGDWVRGQSLLSSIIFLAYLVGFSLIGIPYALLLALLAGLLEFIPYLGPLIAAIPALFFAFGISPWHAVACVIFLLTVQQLQNHLIVPMVMRRVVGLSPVVSILSFLIGAKLFGVAGALFAIPVATALSVVVEEYRAHGPKTIV